MTVNRIMGQINDHDKVDVLRLCHQVDVVEGIVSVAVDPFNETVVDGVALQIGSRDGINVRPDVKNIGGRLGDVVHLGGHRRLELAFGELSSLHFLDPTPRCLDQHPFRPVAVELAEKIYPHGQSPAFPWGWRRRLPGR